MSFDEIGALQRIQQMEQQAAIHSKQLRLKRTSDKFDIWMIALFFILLVPTFGISTIFAIIGSIRYFWGKKIYVKDIATHDKYYVSRDDWKGYKAKQKSKNSETRKLEL
ncbi:hypothetical protein [Listeria fleischmannii]|uniref:hypothetical protein n=1 Tax=Listeria fleischmannii TaxID=1069827 RepID=UPI001623B78D|nr:hypothetical protein [Listeria fleischmannii]MBC1419927.1 hypothetical protein [Listeria fleischmannii]